MPIKANLSKKALERSEELKVHFIPAAINGNGAIKVDEYFNSYTDSDANGVKTNALRGYPLKGVDVKLPEGLQGIVFHEQEKLQIEGADRELKFGGKFNEFTYWNYDKNPSENDTYKKALHWLAVSEAVHAEITSLSEDEDEKPVKTVN